MNEDQINEVMKYTTVKCNGDNGQKFQNTKMMIINIASVAWPLFWGGEGVKQRFTDRN